MKVAEFYKAFLAALIRWNAELAEIVGQRLLCCLGQDIKQPSSVTHKQRPVVSHAVRRQERIEPYRLFQR